METIVVEKEKIQELRNELLKRKNKIDIVVRANKLKMAGDGSLIVPIPNSGGITEVMPTQWAQSQIAEYVGIPVNYFRKLQGYPELFAYNANYWLSRSNDMRMVRMINGEAIAYLSNAYRAIDNYYVATSVLQVAMETLEKQGLTMQVHRAYLTDRVFDMSLMTLETPIEYPSGEKYRLGMHIRNSEVGAAAFSVKAMVVRYACGNGQIFGDPISQRHIGKRLTEGNVWSQRTQTLANLVTLSQIKDMAQYSFSLSNAKKFTDEAEKLHEQPIEPTVEYIRASEKVLQLTEEETRSIWEKVRENNRYELVQAITSTANTTFRTNPERGTELQELGGALVEQPSIWDAVERTSRRRK